MAAPDPCGPRSAPLGGRRRELIGLEQAARVHEAALKLLAEIGLEVLSEDALAHLAASGFRVQGSRVLFEPWVVEEHVAEMRRERAAEARPIQCDDGHLSLSTMVYSHHFLGLDSDRISVFTEETLAEMTRLIDSLAGDRLRGSVPGYPLDAPGPLQPVIRYRIAAENARHGPFPADLPSAATAHYILDMAEVMGRPIRALPVYTHTPLRLGGQSLATLTANLGRVDRIRVSNMPAAGANAPIRPLAAFAVSAAELMGAMVALKVLTGKPVSFYVQVFPFDVHSTIMVFGTPEDVLFQMASVDLNRFYGEDASLDGGDLATMAPLPGLQAAADKAGVMFPGAVLGARQFGCAGTLVLGEVFSPEQLLFDLELRDWVERLLAGIDTTEPGDDLLAEVRAGLDQGFLGHDSTRELYGRLYWYPRLFARGSLEAWRQAGSPSFHERAAAEVHARLAGHSYQLDEVRRQELLRIEQAAREWVKEH